MPLTAGGRASGGHAGHGQRPDPGQVVEHAADVAGEVGERGNRQHHHAGGHDQGKASPGGGLLALHSGMEASRQASGAPGIQLAADDLRPQRLLTSEDGAFPGTCRLVGHLPPVASAGRWAESVAVSTSTAVRSREETVSSEVPRMDATSSLGNFA